MINLRYAKPEDWEILLNWRNDPVTRNNSHNSDLVDVNTHKNWLISVLKNQSRHLFLAIQNGTPIGTVRADFDKGSNMYELSWTVAPSHRGLGVGKEMVKILADKIKTNYRAEIKADNISSIKIAEYAGMSFEKEENGILYFSNCQGIEPLQPAEETLADIPL